jgi:hypothetical protein
VFINGVGYAQFGVDHPVQAIISQSHFPPWINGFMVFWTYAGLGLFPILGLVFALCDRKRLGSALLLSQAAGLESL